MPISQRVKTFGWKNKSVPFFPDDFVCQGEVEGRWQEFYCGSTEGRLLGDDIFVKQVLDKTEERLQLRNSLKQIVEAVYAVYEIPLSVQAEPGRRRNIFGNLILADLAVA